MYVYRTAHHVHDVLCDRHAEASTLYTGYCRGIHSGERIENGPEEFLIHTHSVILDAELILSVSGFGKCGLFYTDGHGPASLRVLDGIGKNVQQYLIQTQLITDNELVSDVAVNKEIKLFVVDVGMDDIPQSVKNFRKIFSST